MNKVSGSLLAGAAGIVLAVSGCAPAGAGSPGHATVTARTVVGTAPTAPVIRLYQDPHFKGGQSMALSELGDELNEFTQMHPAVFSGAWFTGEGTIVVGVALPDDPAAKEFHAMQERLDPGLKLSRTVPAKYSWAQLQAIQDKIVASKMSGAPGDVNGIGLDPVNDALTVEIFRTDADPTLQQNTTVQELAKKYGDALEFSETSSRASAATG